MLWLQKLIVWCGLFRTVDYISRMRCLLLIFLFIICCEFSDETLQQPTDVPEEKKKTSDDEEDKDTKEFIASIEEQEGATAIRIESTQDFTNEKENVKG